MDIGQSRVRLICALVISVCATVSVTAQNDAPVVRILMFSSPTCPECEAVKSGVLAELQDMYGPVLELRDLDIENLDNAELLFRLETQFDVTTTSTPVIFIGNHVLSGQEQCESELADKVALVLAEGGSEFPEPADEGPAAPAVDTPLYMAYFYERGCSHCNLVETRIEFLKEKYPLLDVRKFDMGDRASKLLNEAVFAARSVPEDQRMLAPSVVLGDTVLVKDDVTVDNIEALLAGGSASLGEPPWDVSDDVLRDAELRVTERLRRFSVLVVAGAGLLDGLNPCAFATLIFFISYLTMIGRKGKAVLAVGGSFALSVFSTYLLIGFGFFEFLQAIERTVRIAAVLFYALTAVAAFVLAAFTFRDYLRCRHGAVGDITLQLPKFLKHRIHRTISAKSRTPHFVLGAAAAGFIVSLLELACTGQVYLPTIALVAQTTGFRSRAVPLLVLYNMMFILPLIIVFVVTYFGVSSKGLTDFFQRHAAGVKLATAVLFTFMGVFLLRQVMKIYL